MSSVVKEYYANTFNTNLYINEDIVSSFDQYDSKGNVESKGYAMDQNSDKVAIQGDNTSKFTLLDCDASQAGWQKAINQFAYSSDTYRKTDYVRIDFTNADVNLQFEDLMIGFGAYDKLEDTNPTYLLFKDSGSSDHFYFFNSSPSVNTQTFTIIYDGNGAIVRYVDGVLKDKTQIVFDEWFPGGLKIYAVFNNGGGRNYHYKVKLYQPTTIYPERTLICKNMGKKYILHNTTYVNVQNISDQKNFYINTSKKAFASLVF
jgi:hypothetical protein